ncbi:permease prefix domain 1-containing protein [Micromonospora sp. NBC_01699]|uniref:permease prefix domain 1-containing protein n=1 Tax=Micromonospora sp. NBC_01699 TaxID=2975984 RepID=UPI002E28390D|nr:permease prefix domain 1-containing protein [Micromonospora sp. NBC_01699]
MIDEYVHELGRALHGPARLKSDLLTEARHSLTDSAEGYRDGGLHPAEAERRAITEFGPVGRLAHEYQSELLAGALRALALRVVLVGVVLMATADLMWHEAPWTGPRPPAGYLLLSGSLDWLWRGILLLALGSYLCLARYARSGRTGPVRLARAAGIGLSVSLGLGWIVTVAVYAWSVTLWDSALAWPPMLVGGIALVAVHAWLGRAAYACLATGRPTGGR